MHQTWAAFSTLFIKLNYIGNDKVSRMQAMLEPPLLKNSGSASPKYLLLLEYAQ